MMPSPKTISKALFKLVSFYEFKTVAVIYDGKHMLFSNLDFWNKRNWNLSTYSFGIGFKYISP